MATADTVVACEDVSVELSGARGRTTILRGVDLSISRGEFVALLGTSGAGKTTLLRVLGGLQRVTSGTVTVNGRAVAGPPPGLVTVFQNYAQSLLPWRTVRRNVALGLEHKVSRAERDERVEAAIELVGLTHVTEDYPRTLSGGMQQRVQIARALAMRPSVMLMDEPFGALDAMTKSTLQDELLKVQAATSTTIVFVTHDVDEAVYLSDRALVLAGRPATFDFALTTDLPRPRDQLSTKESPDFLKYRREILQALHAREQSRP